MSTSNAESEMDASPAAGPQESVRAFQTALIYLWLRAERSPTTPMPEPPPNIGTTTARFEMVRRLSTWLGQPPRCHAPACRRAKICRGDPPDCWRNEAPVTDEEIDLVMRLLQYQVREPRSRRATQDAASR